jgi:hypothetical protein
VERIKRQLDLVEAPENDEEKPALTRSPNTPPRPDVSIRRRP